MSKKRLSNGDAPAAAAKKSKPSKLDVLIQCALGTEAISVMQILTQSRRTDFDKTTVLEGASMYTHAGKDKYGDPLHIGVCWQAKEGHTETGQFTSRLLETFKHTNQLPNFWFMAGICAGTHEDTKLGDVVVSKLSVQLGGALKADPEKHLQAEVHSAAPTHMALQNAVGMTSETKWQGHLLPTWNGWEPELYAPPHLPPSMNECVTQLLVKLFDAKCTAASSSSATEEQGQAMDQIVTSASWKNIADTVIDYAVKRKLITDDGLLTESGVETALQSRGSRIRKLTAAGAQTHRTPRVMVATTLTSPFVHKDLTPEKIAELREQTAQRKLYNVEMEIHAFYAALVAGGFSGQYLAAKGVCDFGDLGKEDSYHSIAGETSAAFLYDFIRQHVRSAGPVAAEKNTLDEDTAPISVSPDTAAASSAADAQKIVDLRAQHQKIQASMDSEPISSLKQAASDAKQRCDELRASLLSDSSYQQLLQAAADADSNLKTAQDGLNQSLTSVAAEVSDLVEKITHGKRSSFTSKVGDETLHFIAKLPRQNAVKKDVLVATFGAQTTANLYKDILRLKKVTFKLAGFESEEKQEVEAADADRNSDSGPEDEIDEDASSSKPTTSRSRSAPIKPVKPEAAADDQAYQRFTGQWNWRSSSPVAGYHAIAIETSSNPLRIHAVMRGSKYDCWTISDDALLRRLSERLSEPANKAQLSAALVELTKAKKTSAA